MREGVKLATKLILMKPFVLVRHGYFGTIHSFCLSLKAARLLFFQYPVRYVLDRRKKFRIYQSALIISTEGTSR